MKKILLITDSYPPEIRSASHLMFELAEELYKKKHEVTVATTWPKYNLDASFKSNHYKEISSEDGIKVLRLKTISHHNVNYWIRGISQLCMPFKFIFKLWKYGINPDAVIVYSPPLSLGLVGAWLRYRFKSKFLFNVQDIFPKNAIDLGILENKIVIKAFKALEGFIYKRADVIAAHSKGNQRLLQKEHPHLKDKIKELNNWVDLPSFNLKSEFVDFRKVYGIKKTACVFVFAGIVGPSQGLEVLVDVAEFLQKNKDILFLIIGEGSNKYLLEKKYRKKNLNNIMFKPFISKKEYPYLLKACDIGLVSLSAKNKTPVVPSKLLGYMAASLPVMGILNKESDGHEIIRQAKCGYSSTSDDQEDITNKINKLYIMRHEIKTMGNAGYKYVQRNFSKENCLFPTIDFLT